jgi:hypothetical protein
MIEVTFLCQKKRYGKSGTEGARYGLGPGTEGAVRKERSGKSGTERHRTLLEYRATPLSNGYSPAELLFGRRIRTTLPMNPKRLVSEKVDTSDLKKREEKGRFDQKRCYDKHHEVRVKDELQPTDVVWIKDMRTWGSVSKQLGVPDHMK